MDLYKQFTKYISVLVQIGSIISSQMLAEKKVFLKWRHELVVHFVHHRVMEPFREWSSGSLY